MKEDAYRIFQLYNAAVPENVRRYESSTFAEWTAAQERLGRGMQYVLEAGGRAAGWLRVASDGGLGRFDIVAEEGALDDIVAGALAKLANRDDIYAPVPDYQEGLARRLVEHGFEPGESYTVMARRTVRTVKAPRAVPAIAKTMFV